MDDNYSKSITNDFDKVTLNDDEYFVLGDNRNNSTDSRFPQVGAIHKDEIVGRAFVRIFPFKKFGLIKHA